MAHFTHCPYQGTPYLEEDRGRPTRVYHDHCLPPAMAAVMAEDRRLEASWDELRDAHHMRVMAGQESTDAQVAELNAAGRAMNAHKRYGWAPIYGRACDSCGKPC